MSSRILCARRHGAAVTRSRKDRSVYGRIHRNLRVPGANLRSQAADEQLDERERD